VPGYRAGARKPPTATEVQEAIASLPGVSGVTELPTDDVAHRFQFMGAGGRDLRSEIFSMIVQKGWLLLELRRDSQTLEDVFKHLTKGDERKDRGRALIDDADDDDADDASDDVAAAGSDDADDDDADDKKGGAEEAAKTDEVRAEKG
jgi:ABC-2 type transport system ATP-binding protein